MSRAAVLGAYRALLRARRTAFEGDEHALRAAGVKMREEFEKRRQITDPVMIGKLVKDANNMAVYLLRNVVQGKRSERGTYVLKVDKNRHELRPSPPIQKR